MSYTQQVLSEPAKKPVLVKKGRKLVKMTYTTKSGQVKVKYEKNPNARTIKEIKHV